MPQQQVLIDVSRMLWRRWSGRQATGIDRACIAYLDHFSRHRNVRAVVQRGGFTSVLDTVQSLRLIALIVGGDIHFRRRAVSLLARSFALAPLSDASYRGATYINVGHTGLDLPGHARWIRSANVRAIYYIHDIIPITHPEFCRPGESERHRRRMHTALALAAGIVTNSEDSAKSLVRFAEEEAVTMPPHLVAPLGLSIDMRGALPPPLSAPYFLMVGTIEGRKNYGLILDVWPRLARLLGNATPKLVLIGARGWSAAEVFAKLDNDDSLRPHVMELGQCEDSVLHAYLRHARALLFPSFVEGQGLPLAEALSAGIPVIASDLPVFREAAGSIPEYLSPKDVEAWLKTIMAYLDEENYTRLRQTSLIKCFQAPNWVGHFDILDDYLENL